MPLAVAVTDAVRLLAITAETEFRRADAPEPGTTNRTTPRSPAPRVHRGDSYDERFSERTIERGLLP